jgi:hypothetical protein
MRLQLRLERAETRLRHLRLELRGAQIRRSAACARSWKRA